MAACMAQGHGSDKTTKDVVEETETTKDVAEETDTASILGISLSNGPFDAAVAFKYKTPTTLLRGLLSL